MDQHEFMVFYQGANFKNLSKPVDTSGNKFNWLKIQELYFEKGLSGFKFKYDLNENYRTCELLNLKKLPKRSANQRTRKPKTSQPVTTIFNTSCLVS